MSPSWTPLGVPVSGSSYFPTISVFTFKLPVHLSKFSEVNIRHWSDADPNTTKKKDADEGCWVATTSAVLILLLLLQ